MNSTIDYAGIGTSSGMAAQQSEGNQQREGKVARAIETQTAKLPSDLFMWAAGVAMAGSIGFQIFGPKPKRSLFGPSVTGRAPLASFVGQWVPTLLIFGLYNKIVKVAGSDRVTP